VARRDPETVYLLFERQKDNFGGTDWNKILDNAFELSNLVTPMLSEAGAKGKGVIVMAPLVDLDLPTEEPSQPEAEPADPAAISRLD